MYCLDGYQYQLPEELIAQVPAQRRDDSRLLVLNRTTGSVGHTNMAGLEHYLAAGDVVVVNDTRVVPARLLGKKESGGKVELLVLHPATDQKFYRCLVKSSKGVQEGAIILFENGLRARVCEQAVEGQTRVEFVDDRPLLEILESTGCVPLPPYIRRNGGAAKVDDGRAYQTIYAAKPGAVAAPTAGLHFTEELLNRLKKKGVTLATLTLHVGFGTFQPVRVSDIRQHRLQEEFFEIPQETAQVVNRRQGERQPGGGSRYHYGTSPGVCSEQWAGETRKWLVRPLDLPRVSFSGHRWAAYQFSFTGFELGHACFSLGWSRPSAKSIC